MQLNGLSLKPDDTFEPGEFIQHWQPVSGNFLQAFTAGGGSPFGRPMDLREIRWLRVLPDTQLCIWKMNITTES
jgi:hypothetical protein